MMTNSDLDTVAMHIRLAAQSAGVTDVRMMSVGRPCDLEPLSERVSARLAAAEEGSMLRILPLHSDTYGLLAKSANTGLVVVTPSRLGLADVEDVANLLSISGWRFLGIVPYKSPGIVKRIMGTARRSSPAVPNRRHDPLVSDVVTGFGEVAPDRVVEGNGNGQSHVARLAWRLEHPKHKQRG